MLFTAAKKEYADAIVDSIDVDSRIFTHRLYRDSCEKTKTGTFRKTLNSIKNRAIDRCLLVDDNEVHFRANLGNCVLIDEFDFLNNEEEEELQDLANLLQKLNKMKDFCGALRSLSA